MAEKWDCGDYGGVNYESLILKKKRFSLRSIFLYLSVLTNIFMIYYYVI